MQSTSAPILVRTLSFLVGSDVLHRRFPRIVCATWLLFAYFHPRFRPPPLYQVVRGFLLARDNMQAIVGLVSAMADSGLPCFKFPDTLKNVCLLLCLKPFSLLRYFACCIWCC